MLLVPRRRQPNPVACLPTCVWSVLTFEGYAVDYEEVAAACLLDNRGAVLELTGLGLQEAGWDVEILAEFDLERVKTALDEERPLVAALRIEPLGGEPMAHAVVICGLTEDTLTVMDPLAGDYVALPLHEIVKDLPVRFKGGFFITGMPVHLTPDA